MSNKEQKTAAAKAQQKTSSAATKQRTVTPTTKQPRKPGHALPQVNAASDHIDEALSGMYGDDNNQPERKISPKKHLDPSGGVVKPHILFRLARKNLFFKKLRTSLTVLGVVIGIGSVVFLVSFGFGLQNLVNKQVVGSKSVNTIDVTSTRSKILKLDQQNISAVKGIASVDKVTQVYTAAGKLKVNNSQLDSVVYGTTKDYMELASLTATEGSVLGDGEVAGAIVNTALLTATGQNDNKKAVNQTIDLTFTIQETVNGDKKSVTKPFKISGVIESGSGAEMYIPQAYFTNANAAAANQLKVLVNDQSKIPEVRKGIEALGFSTTSPLDTLDQINQVFTLLKFVLLGFGGIGMLIAILGMFNTLTISLLERTREIGLMITLGARQRDVKRMFVVESLLLSMLGGLFGIAGAYLLGMIVNFVLNRFAQSRGVTEAVSAFSFPPALLLLVVLLSGLLGLIVVYFPARRASRINPIDALRYE